MYGGTQTKSLNSISLVVYDEVKIKEKIMNISEIQKDMKVVGSDGEHVGTVDGIDGDRIKLTKYDSPNGQHNFLTADDVDTVDGAVKLVKTADEILKSFANETSAGGASGAGGTW